MNTPRCICGRSATTHDFLACLGRVVASADLTSRVEVLKRSNELTSNLAGLLNDVTSVGRFASSNPVEGHKIASTLTARFYTLTVQANALLAATARTLTTTIPHVRSSKPKRLRPKPKRSLKKK